MRTPAIHFVLAVCLTACVRPLFAGAPQPESASETLANGLRVVVVHFPQSSSVSIFSYLPLGLASDDADRCQWSHLVEHLALRTTIPSGVAQGNGETLADHLRLDWYGASANWQEVLSHHARWLEGLPFTEASLTAEKRMVALECDNVARNLAAHKFAFAAWAQGYRFGRTHAAVKGDVDRATVVDVQRYRDERLVVPDKTVVCVVGGLRPDAVFAVVAERLGKIKSNARPPAPVTAAARTRAMTWDLPANHLLLTWPIPDVTDADFAPLMVAGYWLSARMGADQQLLAAANMPMAGTDLVIPEGRFFYVSAALRSPAASEAAAQRLGEHLTALRSDVNALSQVPLIAQEVAASLTTIADPEALKAQLPPGMTLAMLEGNIGLQYATQEFRYGSARKALAQRLGAVTAGQVRQAAEKHLAPQKGAACMLRPAA